jgi:hypothetical protein
VRAVAGAIHHLQGDDGYGGRQRRAGQRADPVVAGALLLVQIGGRAVQAALQPCGGAIGQKRTGGSSATRLVRQNLTHSRSDWRSVIPREDDISQGAEAFA